jgi:hypothetical protein
MNTHTPRGWTEAQIAIVQSMWSAGETGQTIADTIGKSRSAVIGVINRGGFKRASGRKTPVYFVSRKRQPRSVIRQAMTVHEQHHAAPITLGGPSWSHPARRDAA